MLCWAVSPGLLCPLQGARIAWLLQPRRTKSLFDAFNRLYTLCYAQNNTVKSQHLAIQPCAYQRTEQDATLLCGKHSVLYITNTAPSGQHHGEERGYVPVWYVPNVDESSSTSIEYVVLDLTLQGGALLRAGMPFTSENATRSPSSKPSLSSSTQLIVVVVPLAVTPATMPLWGCSPAPAIPLGVVVWRVLGTLPASSCADGPWKVAAPTWSPNQHAQ